MNGLEYRHDFVSDRGSRTALNDFLIEIHGLDLTLWDERIGWDPDFVPFSFFDGDSVVATTCIYSLDMIVRGEWCRVAQISSVGTRESLRGRGLNAELTRRAMEWVAERGHRGTFLFSDEDAVGFYAKQGFVERPEWKHRVVVTSSSRPAFRVLEYDRDEKLIRRLVETRTPVSKVLGVKAPKLELFHLLYENAGELRYVEELDLLVAVEQEDGVLSVYDLIGPDLPTWAEIEPLVIGSDTRSVLFEVTPDRLGLTDAEAVEDRGSCLHVIEEEDLISGRVIVPFTAHA
jgi:GNAT superfamily N-acetyltransferase